MNIQPIQNKPNIISFKSYERLTSGIQSNNRMSDCLSKGHLMRDFDTVTFATDYMNKVFSNGANIAVYGCSQDEAYTWGILFHPTNADKRYKIIGYDLVPNVIEDARTGVMNISSRDEDEYFLLPNHFDTPNHERAEVKKSFLECFEKVPSEWLSTDTFNPISKANDTTLSQQPQDSALMTERLKYIRRSDRGAVKDGIDFIPRKGVFDGIIDFKVADIFNIDRDILPESIGMLSFKNGLYHVLDSTCPKYDNVDLSIAERLFKKINSALQKDGLLVLGTLYDDHLYSDYMKNDCVPLYQNGKLIIVCNSSPIHKLLGKIGFEPIFYETVKKRGPIYYNSPISLPSVWRKIRSI